MTGPTQQVATSTTAPSNPDVNPTLSKLLKGVQQAYDAQPNGFFFNKPLYAGTGATTDNALSGMLSNANDPMYSGGLRNNFTEMADIAAGNRFGLDDPGYATLRSKVANDVTTTNLDAFNNSGMFGSDSNRKSLSEGLGNALAGLDYTNFQNDIMRQERARAGLSDAFRDTMLPSEYALNVGQLQDADAQAALQAEYDRATRGANAKTDMLAKLSSILAGNAPVGGTTSTSTTPGPSPLQMILGYMAGNAGQAMRMF